VRYYDISISSTPGGPPVSILTPAGQSVAQWTSHPNGVFNPAALDVEFDIYVAPNATPIGNSTIRLWGVDLATVKAASQFAGNPNAKPPVQGMFLTIRGGMKAGLPLANPKQAGLLAQGLVWQSYANWQGTDQTLDLLLNASGSSVDRPVNLILNWQKGQTLQDAIQSCLSTAFPGTTLNIQISKNLVAPTAVIHRSSSLAGLSALIQSITQQIQGVGSIGVQIVAQGGGITVFDGTVAATPKQIVFTDLVGQPTWQGAFEIWIQTVMRGDINVGDTVKLPLELAQLGQFVSNTPSSFPNLRDNSIIQGNFIVTSQRHVGRFRSPDGSQWSTTLICVPLVPQ
jgi:hypothetical protein